MGIPRADISRAKYEAGTQSAADVLVAETDESKLEEAQRDLERQLSDEQAQLNTLMNRDAFAPLGRPATTSIQMPQLSPTSLRPLVLTHRPEVKMAEARIDVEKWKLQLARREWIPDPALMVKAQRYNDAGQAVSEVDAGVSFPLPWVNFRKYGAGVREAGRLRRGVVARLGQHGGPAARPARQRRGGPSHAHGSGRGRADQPGCR